MMQGLSQHSLRNVEKRLILKMSEMIINEKAVTVEIKDQDADLELKLHLVGYFKRFSPRFFNKNYNLNSNLSKSGSYYFVSRDAKVTGIKKFETITTHDNYLILSLTKPLSGFLQGKNKIGYPVDAGVHRMNNYAWYIYIQ